MSGHIEDPKPYPYHVYWSHPDNLKKVSNPKGETPIYREKNNQYPKPLYETHDATIRTTQDIFLKNFKLYPNEEIIGYRKIIDPVSQ